jgi:hypothetical protein
MFYEQIMVLSFFTKEPLLLTGIIDDKNKILPAIFYSKEHLITSRQDRTQPIACKY